jgi:hypothetical protein
MNDLSDIFSDAEELNVAGKVLVALPDDIGHFPFWEATLGGIVHNAFYDQLHRQNPNCTRQESDAFFKERENYCVEHDIMERLVNAGQAKDGGSVGGSNETLYETVKGKTTAASSPAE